MVNTYIICCNIKKICILPNDVLVFFFLLSQRIPITPLNNINHYVFMTTRSLWGADRSFIYNFDISQANVVIARKFRVAGQGSQMALPTWIKTNPLPLTTKNLLCFQIMYFNENQSIKIPQPSFQVIASRHSKVFLFIIILKEGQEGEVWNYIIKWCFTPSAQQKFL